MKRRVSHRFCPHCKKDLNLKTLKHHKRLYFHSNSWFTTNDRQSPESVPTMQSDSSDNEIDSPPVKSAASKLCMMDENYLGVFEMQPESADSSDIDDYVISDNSSSPTYQSCNLTKDSILNGEN